MSTSRYQTGTYGVLFIPLERRQRPDPNKVYWDTIEADIKSNIQNPNEKMNKLLKTMSTRFEIGIENQLITNEVSRKLQNDRNKTNELNIPMSYKTSLDIIMNMNNSSMNKGKKSSRMETMERGEEYAEVDILRRLEQSKRKDENECNRQILINQPLRSTEALIMQEHLMKGGKYFISRKADIFKERLVSAPSSSGYSTTTPKMWPKETQYTYTRSCTCTCTCTRKLIHALPSANPCSKSSTLQDTLVQCGRLSIIDENTAQTKALAIVKSTNIQRTKLLNHHAKWLKQHTSGHVHEGSSIETSSFLSDTDKGDVILNMPLNTLESNTLDTDLCSKMSKVSMPSSSLRSVHSKTSSSRLPKGYDRELADHLKMSDTNNSLNPYRPIVAYCKRKVRQANALDPVDYRDDARVKGLSNYAVAIKATKLIKGNEVPTKAEINESIARLKRTSVLSYDMRIAETGAVVKALMDIRHPSPGVAAIAALHRAFIQASSMNPNPWILNRSQIHEVFSSQAYWLPEEVIRRLISAYDPENCGVVRYIRLTASLMCCTRSAMNDLMSLIQGVQKAKEAKRLAKLALQSAAIGKAVKDRSKGLERNWYDDKSLPTASDVVSVSSPSTRTSTSNSRGERSSTSSSVFHSKYDGILFLMRTIHGLYEDCEGGVPGASVGMKIEDIMESLSCCVTSVEDEIQMERKAKALVQTIFERGQAEDIIHFNNPNSAFGRASTAVDNNSGDADDTESRNSHMTDNLGERRRSNASLSLSSSLKSGLVLGGNSVAWASESGSSGYSKQTRNTLSPSEDNTTTSYSNGIPDASVILKHATLKTSVRHYPRVSADVFIDALKEHTDVLDVLDKQLTKFRGLITPYANTSNSTCIPYEKSVMESLSFGTKDGSNKSLFHRPSIL